MIRSFMEIDNNELSWRRRKSGHFYKNQLRFPSGTKEGLKIHIPAPSVLVCTRALIRGDCSGPFDSTRWVTAGWFEVVSNS